MQYKQAHEIALRCYRELEPFCEENRIDIVGSLRREKEYPKDIEIVCTPRLVPILDLFKSEHGKHRSHEFCKAVKNLGIILKGNPYDGRMVQIMLPEEIKLDLFIPIPEAYFLQLVIRTGPKEYSHKVIAVSWLKKGWCGTEDGLRLQSESYRKQTGEKNTWICNTKDPTLPPVWEDEYSLYKWLGLEWVPPAKRHV